MSFMLFPPEVNSGLMYAGAGAGPLMTAATAWDELAADLEGTATSYQTVIDNLTTGAWFQFVLLAALIVVVLLNRSQIESD